MLRLPGFKKLLDLPICSANLFGLLGLFVHRKLIFSVRQVTKIANKMVLGLNPRQQTSNTRCILLGHCLVGLYMFQQAWFVHGETIFSGRQVKKMQTKSSPSTLEFEHTPAKVCDQADTTGPPLCTAISMLRDHVGTKDGGAFYKLRDIFCLHMNATIEQP